VASAAECERALAALAERLAGADEATRAHADFDRSLSCRLTDLDVTFLGRLHDGRLDQIARLERPAGQPRAQIRLTMSSDDLLLLVAGDLSLTAAWTSGRVKVQGSVLDLLKLRNIF
jgi:alkyl sulfatase BDS1-like metallo-beta-lactamase superfamily hydrolase